MANRWTQDVRAAARHIRELYDAYAASHRAGDRRWGCIGRDIRHEWDCLDAALNDARNAGDPRWRELSNARQALVAFEERLINRHREDDAHDD